MTNNTETNEQSTNNFYRQLLTCIGLCSFFFLANYLWNSYADSQVADVKSNVKCVSTTSPEVQNNSGVRIKKIQEVEVGERTIGMNPELTDSERATFLPDPKPATWRKLTLEMIKPNAKRLDITLLRPLNWISESQADIGTTIFLDLPEMGAQGFAKVLNIEPCPPIKHGKGNVITGTFHHEAANTIDLYVEGLSKPIGCTDNHPFWSVTRNEFIEAGKLQPGEELHLYSGQTAKVIQILPRPGPEQVHNLEVMNEHVYRVADQGILVHNTCNLHHSIPKFLGGLVKQDLAQISVEGHKLYHELLADALYDNGLDLAPNASTSAWKTYLSAEPWRQNAAFDACRQAMKDLMDYGHVDDAVKIWESFQKNMINDKYE